MDYSSIPGVQDMNTIIQKYSEEFGFDALQSNVMLEPDEFQQALEAADAFSDDPIGFEEISGTLWANVRSLYEQTKVYNRYSPVYQMSCGMLERLIKKMASLCITRTVLEQSGMEFPSLEDCSIRELYRMVSFHFRKSAAAFEGLKNEKQLMDPDLLAWQYRWFSMTERLKATEEKIQNICDGKIKVESLLKRSRLFEGESRSDRPAAKREPKRLEAPKESAFPILGSYSRMLLQEKKNAERAASAAGKHAFRHAPAFSPLSAARPHRELKEWTQDRFNETFTETPERQLLRKMMKQAGADPTEVDFASDQMLPDMLRDFQKDLERSAALPPPPGFSGPSENVRRKLREQRKKKKK